MPPKRKSSTSNKPSKRARKEASRSGSRVSSVTVTESGSSFVPDEEGNVEEGNVQDGNVEEEVIEISDGKVDETDEGGGDSDVELGNILFLSIPIK
jgi:hypothetical protein